MDKMRTYRMVAETPQGLVAVDIVLRGGPDGIDLLNSAVINFLDIGVDMPGAWVDPGTERVTQTLSVQPETPCAHDGPPTVSCRHCGAVAVVTSEGRCPATAMIESEAK